MTALILLLTGLIIPVEQGESIQNALDSAAAGDTVLVLPGEHSSPVQITGRHNGVVLLGDPSAPWTVTLSGENLTESIVIIDGQINGSVDSSTVISGFTFMNGTAAPEPFGGGVHTRHASAVIEYSIFNGCKADNGGAIYAWKGAPSLRYCVFQNNECESAGGAVYLYSSDAVIEHCRFLDNTSRDDGGGIFCYHSSPVIFNCLFKGGYAHDDGGGIYCYAFSDPVISFSTFTENFALYTGSAVYFRVNSSPEIHHCIATGNEAPAFYIQDGGSPSFSFNCVWGNPDGNYGNLPDPTGTGGNISQNPLLTGDMYLSQTAAGQPLNSPCVDAGSGIPVDYGLELTWTRTDSIPDSSTVDMGYHHGFDTFMSLYPQQTDKPELLVYPNPASSSFSVALPVQYDWYTVRFLDLAGRTLQTVEPADNVCIVNTSQLQRTGLYIVHASGNGIILSKPVTVIR